MRNEKNRIMRIGVILTAALLTGLVACATESSVSGSGSSRSNEISAEDVKTNVESGPLNYDHVIIVGDLSFDQADYEYIKITNSEIKGNISFKETTLNKRAVFKNTLFHGTANFFGTTFEQEADFNGSRFYEDANFSQCRFLEGATFDFDIFNNSADFTAAEFDKFGGFYNAAFLGNATFELCQFNGAFVNLDNTQFRKDVNFAGCQFNTYLSFMEAKIGKIGDFHASNFNRGVNFRNTTFLGPTKLFRSHFVEDSVFRGVGFNDSIDFTSTKFDGPSFFAGARFNGTALFNNAQFIGPSDFSNATFERDLGLNSTRISTMVLDGSTFSPQSRLYLAKADINRLMVRWDLIKDILSFDSSAYLSLIKNYRDMGLSEADDCYYRYRYLSQVQKGWGSSKIMDILASITCGYGVKPERPIICSLFLILVCMSVIFLGRGLRSAAGIDEKTSLYNSLYYCLAIFFTIPLPDFKPVGRYRYVPVVLRALSWTLFALLIGTLSKVMIK